MNTLPAFAPFIAFLIAETGGGSLAGLVAGLLVSFALLMRDWAESTKGEPSVFNLCVFFLFAVLTVYDGFGELPWSQIGIRIRVEAGMLLIVLLSILARRPFARRFARQVIPKDRWTTPEFRRTADAMSAAWACAFAAIVVAELLSRSVPQLPQVSGLLASVAALCCAARFCSRYPARRRPRA